MLNILSQYLRVNKMSLVVVKTSFTEVTVGQGILQEVPSVELVPRVFNLTREWSFRDTIHVNVFMRKCEKARLGWSHQHWIHFHPSTLKILSDGGDLIIGQVGCVVIVQLQQTLQLIFCLVTNMLENQGGGGGVKKVI